VPTKDKAGELLFAEEVAKEELTMDSFNASAVLYVRANVYALKTKFTLLVGFPIPESTGWADVNVPVAAV
jgi:hypothetical protein